MKRILITMMAIILLASVIQVSEFTVAEGATPMMRQLIVGGFNGQLSPSTAGYSTLSGGSYNWTTARLGQVVSIPGALRSLAVRLSAPPANGSYCFTLMKNGVAQGLSVTLSGPDIFAIDSWHLAYLSAGDSIGLRCVPSGTPDAVSATFSCIFDGFTADESLILGTTVAARTATRFTGLQNGCPASSSDEIRHTGIMPTSGKLTNLYVTLPRGPGGSSSSGGYRFTLRLNGASTPLSCTITGTNTTSNDTTHKINISAGDSVALMIEPIGGPALSPTVSYGLTFVADNPGETVLMAQSHYYPTLYGLETYNSPVQTFCEMGWLSTESDRYQLTQEGFALKNLYVWASQTSTATFTLTVRASGQDTPITVTIPSGSLTGSDTIDTYTLNSAEPIDIKCVSTKSDAVYLRWSLVCCYNWED